MKNSHYNQVKFVIGRIKDYSKSGLQTERAFFVDHLLEELSIKKVVKYHLIILKKYAFAQNFKAAGQKSSLPCPSEISTLKPHKTVHFIVRTFKFWKNVYFIKIYK